MKINLTAIIKTKPEFVDKMKSILENMVLNSRKEVDCIQYDLHQNISEPNIFIFHEIWKTAAALESHNTQPYIQDFISRSEKIVAEPILIYKTNRIQ
jgi:quinol monooxygenase YgiN